MSLLIPLALRFDSRLELTSAILRLSGRNCIFVYAVAEDGSLTLTDKNIAPRPTDGPRHVWPHPNGRYVYSLQEHTSMVDVFKVSSPPRPVGSLELREDELTSLPLRRSTPIRL